MIQQIVPAHPPGYMYERVWYWLIYKSEMDRMSNLFGIYMNERQSSESQSHLPVDTFSQSLDFYKGQLKIIK